MLIVYNYEPITKEYTGEELAQVNPLDKEQYLIPAHCTTVKPLDYEAVLESAKKTGKVVVVEEHSVIGGLGSAVCDLLSEKYPVPVKKIGMNDEYGMSGSAADLLEHYGFSANNIIKTVKEMM